MAQTRTHLSDLPAEAQAALVDMTPHELGILACEARAAKHPSDPESATEGARRALRKPAPLLVDDPLDTFAALYGVLQTALGRGASGGLDVYECAHLERLAELAAELLEHHAEAVTEAGDRLRAASRNN